jgi:hypothetical protein
VISTIHREISAPRAVLVFSDENMRFRPKLRYKPTIEVHLPESETNRQLGMLMFTVNYQTENDPLQVFSVSRSAMLYYRSRELRWMRTLAFSWLLLFGWMKESQLLSVDMPNLMPNSKVSYILTIGLGRPARRIYNLPEIRLILLKDTFDWKARGHHLRSFHSGLRCKDPICRSIYRSQVGG